MRYLIIVVAFFLKGTAYTQNLQPPFSIVYQSGYLSAGDPMDIQLLRIPKGYHPVSSYEIIVTNEAALVHHFGTEKERMGKSPGAKFGHGNIYTDFKNKREYHQIYANQLDRHRYLIEKSFPAFQFDLIKDSIHILGYTCYKAVLQKDPHFITTVWYTPAIPFSVSNNGFTGLPGAVLAFERVSNGVRFVSIARSVTSENRKIKKPAKGIPITANDYAELQKNARMQ